MGERRPARRKPLRHRRSGATDAARAALDRAAGARLSVIIDAIRKAAASFSE